MIKQELSKHMQGLYAFELFLSQRVDNMMEDDSVLSKIVNTTMAAENALSHCVQELNDLGFVV